MRKRTERRKNGKKRITSEARGARTRPDETQQRAREKRQRTTRTRGNNQASKAKTRGARNRRSEKQSSKVKRGDSARAKSTCTKCQRQPAHTQTWLELVFTLRQVVRWWWLAAMCVCGRRSAKQAKQQQKVVRKHESGSVVFPILAIRDAIRLWEPCKRAPCRFLCARCLLCSPRPLPPWLCASCCCIRRHCHTT